jgi:hypothetical protein
VKLLTSERDKLIELYTSTKDELNKCKTKQADNAKAQTQQHSLAVQSILHRVENERDTALYDLRNLMKERDSLVDRLNV